ncbi:MAG: hypothetical protein WD823_09230 [Sulfuricaulis sp.]|uniref:hypothetical protein n=1 Tax=Sulfuricaulis sp. TaxID=2003553 RepID=UPI0034A32C09
MRKFIVLVTLCYTTATLVVLGFVSNWLRDSLLFEGSVIVPTLVFSIPIVLVVAVMAYRRENEWLTVALLAIVLGSGWYVAKTHHAAYGEWLPSLATAEVETSGTTVLNAHGQTIRYRLELHNPGTITHREYLVVTRGGTEQRIRIPIFDDARSGYVSAKAPNDWIILHPTPDTNVYRADIGRFLFVRKSFQVNLRTRAVKTIATKPSG